ncbi:putative deacylase [Clostridium pasteurianum DSM 525 = ATCC 6013]|uniref:Putative deacylase n=1 Tax=Clostridium pasteurianum DSM 525 = ATCC 6013 TaxID=1262449 RepID=A0A0H3J1Y2_CLOPA|nr:M14 family metallopeptidase [Clostridium pasteurianum]AJA47916.1 putative deacylase [Clostridium pasteurianum DSM 525 = ATCC 6013]AJA51904.1 putative deacylase [Clostridium pasteurianum DSM 525 = ATCC 6013]AOZ75204.1 succinylglutamate desuccinylase [Clostridium pasteurianum DSM 525 = ATCC 6013]AOZ78999.1 succinylglutamate desuccinylase [Clostridium pasteurianum]ELP59819.1 succinylglutamate desuccinylase [Clostridium pasteurianum DSM 525 = ATCC 6013]
MKREIIFRLESPYRDTMRITAFRFGDYENKNSEKACAIVGATRGNEAQQIYVCSRLVEVFRKLEEKGKIASNKQILVIPTVNNYSMNTNKRFWSLDNTDINRMFPGYDLGETTQRIAYNVFEQVKNYTYGIQFPSYYMPGEFIPHIRIMHTGYEKAELGREFGLPYVYIRDSRPYDTTTLNYNWQLWNTSAFSLYAGKTTQIDESAAEMAIRAVIRFLNKMGVCNCSVEKGFVSEVINSKYVSSVISTKGGIFQRIKRAGHHVIKGELLGRIMDPYDGSVHEELFAGVDGLIFFVCDSPFVYESTYVYKIIPSEM